MSLKLVFMGSPDFAVPALTALHDAGHRIAAVYCQPPRPAGRGLALRPCAVQLAAERLGLPIRSPASLRRDPAIAAEFASLDADVAVVAAYGLILPQQMLNAPRRSCINIHASLLPRWRGAAPIQAAILAGDAQAGVTIMQMQAGLDTGPMLLAEAIPLDARSTTPWLHDRLAEIGARLVLRALAEPPAPTPQSGEGVTYAPRLTREDGRIDWSRPAAEIDRRFRALTPWPGLFTMLDGQVLKVLGLERLSDPPSSAARPGTTLDAALGVRCGDGAIRLTRIQNSGRAAMDASAFLRGRSVPAGTSLA